MPVVEEPLPVKAAPGWMQQPTLQVAIIERIRAGGTLEEIKEYYRFMREIEANEAERAATNGFVAMQAELPAIPKEGEIDIGKGRVQRYMRWEDINKLIKPVLSQHGFALNFHFVEETDTHITMTAILKHRSGYIDQTTRKLPLDKSGSKNIVQSYGSTQSYAQRYLAIALLNLVAEGEDDDAAGADDGQISHEQIMELEKLILLTGRSVDLFCKKFRIGTLGMLPAEKYREAFEFLHQYIKVEEIGAATKS